MGEQLTLPVPETLEAVYAVASTAPVTADLARTEIARRIEPPLRDLTLGMLDSPMVTLDQRPAADWPPLPTDLLTAYGAAPADLADLARATHLLVVRAAYRPGRPPAHEWAARTIAHAVPGTVIDVFTPQILTPERLERSLPSPDGTVRLTDWVLLPHTPSGDGYWFTTRGLARFGLPELQTEDVPAPLVEPWARVLNGLTHRLLDLWHDALRTAADTARLPAVVSVGLGDVAAAQGLTEPVGREIAVRLHHDGDALTVHPVKDGPARLESLCAALFGRPCR
ncbi:hypothetical protein [Actinomadura rifamycini]|uniref:hypothetical protein n=1 Tax=Actinomadura rifamycini TaxID=31962 RepID=UPI000420E705|nr:hypothetical protein [Actinomadura rifamycini]